MKGREGSVDGCGVRAVGAIEEVVGNPVLQGASLDVSISRIIFGEVREKID